MEREKSDNYDLEFIDDYRVEIYDRLFKIVLIGDMSVGKTNILSRFSHNLFYPEMRGTIGIDFTTKTVKIQDQDETKRLKLQILDTSGCERFRAMCNVYYRGAVGVILVYDITSRDSFKSLNFWLTEIQQYTTNPSLVIVGNKIDLAEKREVSTEEAQSLASSHNALYIETSACTGDNITDAFKLLIRNIYVREARPQIIKGKPISLNSIKINSSAKEDKKCCSV